MQRLEEGRRRQSLFRTAGQGNLRWNLEKVLTRYYPRRQSRIRIVQRALDIRGNGKTWGWKRRVRRRSAPLRIWRRIRWRVQAHGQGWIRILNERRSHWALEKVGEVFWKDRYYWFLETERARRLDMLPLFQYPKSLWARNPKIWQRWC